VDLEIQFVVLRPFCFYVDHMILLGLRSEAPKTKLDFFFYSHRKDIWKGCTPAVSHSYPDLGLGEGKKREINFCTY
jgi:hypothetical protein